MIHVQGHIPDKSYVACSGGPDSMAILDFCNKNKSHVSALFIDHNTEASAEGKSIVQDYCNRTNISFISYAIPTARTPGKSLEECWRDERYLLFHLASQYVITGHHLDDCVDEYLMNTLVRGQIGIIPYRNKNVIRPFRLTSKERLLKWCLVNSISFVDDQSNYDAENFLRPRIRNTKYDIEKNINPGIKKVVKKMVLAEQMDIIADMSEHHCEL
tara:strand:+ start:147 stop:791 length:645 start_codon:yes stop_codon:yes gene_type:complete